MHTLNEFAIVGTVFHQTVSFVNQSSEEGVGLWRRRQIEISLGRRLSLARSLDAQCSCFEGSERKTRHRTTGVEIYAKPKPWRVAKRCEEGKWLGWDLDPPANLERALLSHRRTALFCVRVLRDVIHTHLTTLAAAPFA